MTDNKIIIKLFRKFEYIVSKNKLFIYLPIHYLLDIT